MMAALGLAVFHRKVRISAASSQATEFETVFLLFVRCAITTNTDSSTIIAAYIMEKVRRIIPHLPFITKVIVLLYNSNNKMLTFKRVSENCP